MADEELRPKPVPTPPPGRGHATPEQLPGEGRPPIKTGSVVMSDWTRKQLQAVGWNEGDPIPGDLGARLKEIQAEVIQEKQDAKLEDSEVAAGWKPPKASFVNIEELPDDKKEEIAGYLAEYKQQVEEEAAAKAAGQVIEDRIPENVQGPMRELTKQQIAAAEAAKTEREAGRQSTIVDDREEVQATTEPPAGVKVPDGKKYGGSIGAPSVADKIEKLKRDQEQAQEAASVEKLEESVDRLEKTVDAVTTGPIGHEHLSHCPRCIWPLDMPFDIEPSKEDKMGFMASILGVNRFEKKYELMGGNLVGYYRSLTTEEAATLQYQLGTDVRNGDIRGDGEYMAWLMEYRLVMSLSRVEVGGNVVLHVPTIVEWAKENPPPKTPEVEPPPPEEANTEEAFMAFGRRRQVSKTPLPRMREWFYQQVTQEPMRRMLGQQHREFQRLVEGMEAMTSNESFWKGIELPA